MNAATCPCCGQRIMLRHGARLSRHLADIYDAVARHGIHGVKIESLAGALYPGKPSRLARAALRSSIVHLNERLESSDVRILMQPRRVGLYRIVTVRPTQRIKIGAAA